MLSNSDSTHMLQAPNRRCPTFKTRLWWGLKDHGHFILPSAAAILTLVSTHILLGPVLNRSGDNMYHLLNEFAILHGILAGDNPLGPIGMEFGQPLLRFYQALFYLYNIGVHLITGLSLKFLHNLTIVVCFALSPFSYMYCLRKLGLNRWAAAIGSFFSMISIAAFGNSFEAYHQAGIVTQSMGGLFFPWFMGHFIGMLRGENRASSTAVLFALAFLSHAIMSVFAVFAGALYFAVAPIRLRPVLKKLTAFCVLGTCLVSFWALPFIAHTYQMRPIPDSIVRGGGVHWFTSVSKDELAMVLFTGRLLDDPPRKGDARNENDKFMDKISIIGTLKPRPPAVSILTALGVVVALFGFRRTSRRFLLAGFFFSLMLFAGPDDFRWLKYLPFIKQIQTFRCTYLIEFFAFGLVGIGVWTLFKALGIYAWRRRPFLKYPFVTTWILLALTGACLCGAEIVLLGQRHLVVRNPSNLDAMADAMSTLPNRGYPFRVTPVYKGRYKIRQGWFSVYGYQPYCTHWKGIGPTAALYLCRSLGSSSKNNDLHALAGIRFFSSKKDKAKKIIEAKDKERDRLFERLPNSPDRHGKSNSWHYLLDTGRDHFLRPLVGKPLPVICTHSQWIWLTKAWAGQYRRWLWEESTPIPMRVRSGGLEASGLKEQTAAVVYLDHTELKADLPILKQLTAQGGIVISPVQIPGIATVVPTPKQKLWDLLPDAMQRPPKAKPERDHREEQDPGFEKVWVSRIESRYRSFQNFAFDVDVLEPTVAVLPMEAAPGWKATLNSQVLPAFSTGPDLVGVLLPKGAHRLAFKWEMPLWHQGTVWVLFIAIAIVLGIWIRGAANRLKR
ncbi:MAG: hypothetical protein GY847_22650 [Proteobacteria bacterium]|nr:hypothetical protein [Pseudomonadota bacterium]